MASSTDDRAGKVWVLDTETKGTGANMVPLERVLRKGSDAVPGFRLPERRRPQEASTETRQPYRFRVVDLMTRQVLADDVGARHAIEALAPMRSIMDVIVYAWDDTAGQWTRLPFGEAKALWELRDKVHS